MRASSPAISPTLRLPSHSCRTATATASGVNTRSGARITQRPRTASWRSLTCRASTGREVCAMIVREAPVPLMPVPSRSLRSEGTWRDQARRNVGMVEGVELCPQHVALEAHGIDDGSLLRRRRRMDLDVVEGEVGIAVGLVQAAPEILHGPLADESIALQHAGDALAVDGGREQLGERGGHGFQQRALAHEVDV